MNIMAGIELNYSDITEIFKENLKIENLVKTIRSIFLNKRYASKINYKPYFQRNYVWDDEKASYFIESILLGTEIPPLVFFQTKEDNEVIDGRQRYETIERFLNDKLVLKEDGLKCLKTLAGKRYSMLDGEIQEIFETTRLRILQCSVVNEPSLTDEKEDKIKKEIFRRYNSGITSLQKEEIERAAFIHDNLTKQLNILLNDDNELLDILCDLYLPKSKIKAQKRDKINVIITRIRMLITLPFVPIHSYANGKSKVDIIRKYYYTYVYDQKSDELISKIIKIVKCVKNIQNALLAENHFLGKSNLLFECLFWGMYILYDEGRQLNDNYCDDIVKTLNNSEYELFLWSDIDEENQDIKMIFEPTGSHYYKSVLNRYRFISNYFSEKYAIDYLQYIKNKDAFNSVMNNNISNTQFKRYKLNKALPETVTIDDIIAEMERSRFLVRPEYQRSEVKNIQKASYLLESIMLGIQIPPIFIYKRKDKIKEVIDGQQRLLTILGFLGKPYIDEHGKKVFSEKNQFSLSKLKILSELDKKNIEKIEPKYIDRILDFSIDVVEIDQELNPDFNEIDLFLRLNTKPYSIKENSFEMWNAYVDKNIIIEVKRVSDLYAGKVFRSRDTRMKVEELITSLAYIDYRTSLDNASITDVLNIYKRYGRISARIMSKDSMTKTLSNVSNKNPQQFVSSVRKVDIFAQKILLLVNNDTTKLNYLFAHKRKGTQIKTDQNFYFLWNFIKDITKEDIIKNREEIAEKISKRFSIIQNTPENYTIEQFIESLK